ncbi:hypothetical protein ACNKHS_10985 [Shigella flexneri]
MQAKARRRVDILMQQAAFSSSRISTGTPPGLEVVDVRRTFGVRAPPSAAPQRECEKSSQLNQNAARAIANRCMVWLVEPPVASRRQCR